MRLKFLHTPLPFLALLLAACAGAATAQLTSSDIVGTVSDSSGAILPGARVTLINTQTKVQSVATTNSAGDYRFTLLLPGVYSLRIEAPSFKTEVIPAVRLAVGDLARENASLQAGGQSETVEVAAEEPLLQRESSSITSVVTEESVQDLPLNARNINNLIQIQAGVSPGQSQSISSGNAPNDRRAAATISANGQNDQFNNQLIDGMDNNEGAQGLVGVRPSVDAIAEVKVDTNNFTAEVGRSAGAVINLITKSGTNTFHGSLYEYFRNDITDARDTLAQVGVVKKPKFRQNQFGGSIGGPIFKDRTFFFGDVEDSRIIHGFSSGLQTVPTLFEEQNPGNFSDRKGPNIPTAALNPTGLDYFRLYPAPNLGDSTTLVNNFTNVINMTSFVLTADGRIDHHFSNGDTLYGRYSYNNANILFPGAFPAVSELGTTIQPGGVLLNYAGQSIQKAHSVIFAYAHPFNDHTVLEVKAGYNRIDFKDFNLNSPQNLDTLFGVVNGNAPGIPGTSGLTPIDPLNGGYSLLGDSVFTPITNTENTFQEQALLNYSRGKHEFKFGGELIRRQVDYFQSPFPLGLLFYAGVTGNPIEDLLTGRNVGSQRQNLLVSPGFRRWEPSGFAQDTWRITPSLTFNLGVRYDIFTPYSEVQNRYANFNYDTLTLVQGSTDSRVGIKTSYNNFAPRVGFSKSIGTSTVLRGGYGITFYPSQIGAAILLYNPPTSYQYRTIGGAFLGKPLGLPAAPSTTNLAGGLTYARSDVNTTRLQTFNVAIQQEIAKNVLTLAYVGELGDKLLFEPFINLPAPNGPYATAAPGAPPAYTTQAQLPAVTAIQGYLPTAISNYNALQAVVARRFSNGFSLNANYTWAHGLSNGATGTGGNIAGAQGLLPSNVNYDYGNSDNDVRNRFAISATYELPFGKEAHGFRAALIKGYSVNLIDFWQTGLPFTVVSAVTNPNGLAQINLQSITTDRPNVTGQPLTISGPNRNQLFNLAAFTPQIAGTAGNERPNQLYGLHQRRADLSLFKTTQLTDHASLQFRIECFNLSDTPNFAIQSNGYTISAYTTPHATGPVPGDTPSTAGAFGQATTTTQGSNPRQFQFALKLLF